MAIDKEGNLTQDKIYTERRFGRIDIASQIVEYDTETLQKVYSMVIPTEISFDYAQAIFRVVAMSEHFEPVPLGSITPYYKVTITKNPDDRSDMRVIFKKL